MATNPEIIQHAREVHDQLGKTRPDPTRQPAVDDLRKSLSNVIEQPSHEPHYKTLADTLFRERVELELAHPHLAESIDRLANALAAIGL